MYIHVLSDYLETYKKKSDYLETFELLDLKSVFLFENIMKFLLKLLYA